MDDHTFKVESLEPERTVLNKSSMGHYSNKSYYVGDKTQDKNDPSEFRVAEFIWLRIEKLLFSVNIEQKR